MLVPLPSSLETTYSLLAARRSCLIFTRLLGEPDDGDIRGHLSLADKVLAPYDGRSIGPQILPLDRDPPQERRGARAKAQELLGHAGGDALVDVVSSHRGRARWPARADGPAVPRLDRLIRPLLPQPGNIGLETAINTSEGKSLGWAHDLRILGGHRSGRAVSWPFGALVCSVVPRLVGGRQTPPGDLASCRPSDSRQPVKSPRLFWIVSTRPRHTRSQHQGAPPTSLNSSSSPPPRLLAVGERFGLALVFFPRS